MGVGIEGVDYKNFTEEVRGEAVFSGAFVFFGTAEHAADFLFFGGGGATVFLSVLSFGGTAVVSILAIVVEG